MNYFEFTKYFEEKVLIQSKNSFEESCEDRALRLMENSINKLYNGNSELSRKTASYIKTNLEEENFCAFILANNISYDAFIRMTSKLLEKDTSKYKYDDIAKECLETFLNILDRVSNKKNNRKSKSRNDVIDNKTDESYTDNVVEERINICDNACNTIVA